MKKNLKAMLLPAALCLLTVGCDVADYEGDGYAEMNNYIGMPEAAEWPEEGDRFDDFTDNPFVKVSEMPTSTFSVDADGASYAIMRRYVEAGFTIHPSSVRIEEFLNYFTFDYAAPTGSHTAAINGEVGICPWDDTHRLVRLGIKGKELAADEVPQANFVFLVDVSGSMDSSDKLDLLKSGLTNLLYQLKPDDRISLITYSGEVKKVLESTPVKQADKIKNAIKKLKADGCTAGGKALKMAYEEALANYNPACNNRVIMGTDGDFNVGVTNTDSLVAMVERYAKKGIYMTCLGFGMGNLNDAMMEKISNSGNGTYYYIDSESEMMKVFVNERERFVCVANDAKCQVTFDSTLVSAYRLIGYENRVMNNEDFEDDTKDAGEIGAGQTITALYEIVPTALFEQREQTDRNRTFATFDFRYKKALGNNSLELKLELSADDLYENAETGVLRPLSENLNFAAGVAAYGMVLRSSPYKGSATFDMAANLVEKSLGFDPNGYRRELLHLIKKAPNPEE